MRFSSITALLALFTGLAYTAALNPATLNSLSARVPDTDNVYESLVGYELPDGHRKIDFYFNGAFAGSVVETDDGADFFDESGAPFDIEDADLVKRVNPAMVAARFGGLFKRWGKRVWDFFYCMGLNVAWKCGDEFLDCASSGTPPWSCISGIACAGVNAKKCL
ncbi:hypothetical protein E8E13_007151 [Curvularia kusanoi]|uniref:Uncharacterized protein n=1 Tax=Curvularia kusanoi TaxID=90978 RepID=A0A9P4TB48_CURKU|nr:hypothetical protein E8E13_007151 [Curvularia kusanoi]